MEDEECCQALSVSGRTPAWSCVDPSVGLAPWPLHLHQRPACQVIQQRWPAGPAPGGGGAAQAGRRWEFGVGARAAVCEDK